MFGGITDLPELHSYEQALGHYTQIKPLRGSNNVRPICKTKNGRRKKHMQIIKRDEAIACRLYDTDVVTFYKDGTVEFNSGGFISNTTHSFASGILFPHVWFATKLGNTEVMTGKRFWSWSEPDQVTGSYHVPPSQTFKMKREGDTWVAIDPPKHFEYYLKRKEYNARRKPLKEFQDHCIRMAKLADAKEVQGDQLYDVHADWYYRDIYKDLTLHCHKDLVDGSNSWGRLVPMVLETARARGNLWDRERRNTHYFDTQRIKDAISNIVKYAFADELFEEREVHKRTFNGNERYIWKKYEGGRE
jgi:hypothetical protein